MSFAVFAAKAFALYSVLFECVLVSMLDWDVDSTFSVFKNKDKLWNSSLVFNSGVGCEAGCKADSSYWSLFAKLIKNYIEIFVKSCKKILLDFSCCDSYCSSWWEDCE